MLTKNQVVQIKEHLEKAQNPLFLFDNDQDGLCSFLLLQRYIGRGKGVPIKSFPALTEDYFRKVEELNADYIFILDKPVVSKEFWEKVEQSNIPVIWIDHHNIDRKEIPKFVNYYNPLFNKSKTNEPVTYLCYQVTKRKKDLWIAVVGCIYDYFIPDYYKEFKKSYPDLALSKDTENPFEIYIRSEIGRIARILGNGLKDTTTNVVKMLKFLMNAETPYEVLEENSKTYSMHKRFNDIDKKYQKLLEKAKSVAGDEDILFFQYAGDLSISSNLSDELSFLFPDKVIVVIYVRGIKANISIRGEKIREPLLKVLEKIEGATGGGHENAVGAQVRIEDVEKFKEDFEKAVKHRKL